MSPALRVLVVDTDAALRQGLCQAFSAHCDFEVVGWAQSPRTAGPKIATYQPDLLVIEVDAAAADATSLLGEVQERSPALLRIGTARAELSPPDLAQWQRLGVAAVLRRPPSNSTGALAEWVQSLAPYCRRARRYVEGSRPSRTGAAVGPGPVAAACPIPRRRIPGGRAPQVVGIGVSTGGPKALAEVLPLLPADFPLPIVLVQHMPAGFTRSLAESLAKSCRIAVREAEDGEPLMAGVVLIAPGGRHLRVQRTETGAVVQLTDDPPRCSCRPSVDYLFESLGAAYAGRVLAVVLTGMGEDGWQGSRVLHDAGACVLAQDEASSTVYGMPRGPIEAGIAAPVPLTQMAEAIVLAARGNSCN
jgi:two-component system chemotaxis response regulator CheB